MPEENAEFMDTGVQLWWVVIEEIDCIDAMYLSELAGPT